MVVTAGAVSTQAGIAGRLGRNYVTGVATRFKQSLRGGARRRQLCLLMALQSCWRRADLLLAADRDARNCGEPATVGVPRAARAAAASGSAVANWSEVSHRGFRCTHGAPDAACNVCLVAAMAALATTGRSVRARRISAW